MPVLHASYSDQKGIYFTHSSLYHFPSHSCSRPNALFLSQVLKTLSRPLTIPSPYENPPSVVHIPLTLYIQNEQHSIPGVVWQVWHGGGPVTSLHLHTVLLLILSKLHQLYRQPSHFLLILYLQSDKNLKVFSFPLCALVLYHSSHIPLFIQLIISA